MGRAGNGPRWLGLQEYFGILLSRYRVHEVGVIKNRMKMIDTGINEKDKEKIIALISALAPTAKIILFGSRARGRFSDFSDIDLALDMVEKIPPLLMGEIADVLAATNIVYKIEIVDRYFATQEMQESIKREGIVWKS